MRLQIRQGVFETNSSSVHSITMVSDSEYNGWKEGIYVYDDTYGKLVSIEEAKKSGYDDPEYRSRRYYTFDEFFTRISYDTYNDVYTTQNGEVVHAFGYYGY